MQYAPVKKNKRISESYLEKYLKGNSILCKLYEVVVIFSK